MPCYEVNTVSVEFKIAHRNLLEAAVKVLGWSIRSNTTTSVLVEDQSFNSLLIDLVGGKVSIRDGQQGVLNQLKRAYSLEAVKLAAKVGGWKVSGLKVNLDNTKLQLERGYL